VLKSWLNENLPGVVERMVQAEIERITRGRWGRKTPPLPRPHTNVQLSMTAYRSSCLR
jgi:hypothetical protein